MKSKSTAIVTMTVMVETTIKYKQKQNTFSNCNLYFILLLKSCFSHVNIHNLNMEVRIIQLLVFSLLIVLTS